ncbi:MAG: hypothetical protein KDJ38_16710 [Gammaproteobacteria bacterium]|nr:hypothetical protein [Gammaproteobacteria bacterium]
MKLVLGLSLAMLTSAAFACPGMSKDKEITFLPQELQSPVTSEDQVDPRLLTQAEKQEQEQKVTN